MKLMTKMNTSIISFVIIFFFYDCVCYSQNEKVNKQYDPIDISQFYNSAHHWYDINADDNVIEPKKNQPRYKKNQIVEIADNILLYQKNNGGWPKNYDMLAVLTDEQKKLLVASKNILNTTFDNWTTHPQVEYLAQAYLQTGERRFEDACLRGIDFILSSQYNNGGWPQFFPDTSGYKKFITFNDGVIAGIMTVLKNIVDNKPQYSFVDVDRKKKVKNAFDKGLSCILKCQIISKGRLTAWGQQHDNIDLHPQWARTFEPASICNGESVDVVLLLMSIDNPSEEIINSVQSAIKWFKNSAIEGIKIETKHVDPIEYKWSTISIDRVVVNEPDAKPIWTRFYEIDTERPLFCNRDGKVVYSLAEVHHERRGGYSWYTYDPQTALDNYHHWQKKWAPHENVLD